MIGFLLGLHRDNGKENGNYRDYIGIIGYILWLYRHNGKENKKMEAITIGYVLGHSPTQ